MQDRSIRLELLDALNKLEKANEAQIYKEVRDILLRHSIFDDLMDDESHNLGYFTGLGSAI